MRYQFIKEQAGRFALSALCRVLRVSRSGYAAWHKRLPSRRSQEEQELLIHIQAAHRRSKGTYGSPCIHQQLRQGTIACSLGRVTRIMHKHGVTARSLRRFAVTTDSDHALPVASNRLAQDFTAPQPDAVWAGTSRTCGPARAGFTCPWS